AGCSVGSAQLTAATANDAGLVKNEIPGREATHAESPRRYEQWTPRFAGAWAALTFALCTIALGFPALGGEFLVNPGSDQFFAGYPFRAFAAQSLQSAHGIPLWNPYLFGGVPY